VAPRGSNPRVNTGLKGAAFLGLSSVFGELWLILIIMGAGIRRCPQSSSIKQMTSPLDSSTSFERVWNYSSKFPGSQNQQLFQRVQQKARHDNSLREFCGNILVVNPSSIDDASPEGGGFDLILLGRTVMRED